jgi:hypothetical protein
VRGYILVDSLLQIDTKGAVSTDHNVCTDTDTVRHITIRIVDRPVRSVISDSVLCTLQGCGYEPILKRFRQAVGRIEQQK